MRIADVPILLSLLGFVQGATACTYLLARRRHIPPWHGGLVAALSLLLLRLLMCAGVHAAWFARGDWFADAGTACAFFFWPLLLNSVAGTRGGKARAAVMVPAAAATVLLAAAGGGWFPAAFGGSADPGSPRTWLTLLSAVAGVLVTGAYAASLMARTRPIRFDVHGVPCERGPARWQRPFSFLCAGLPVAMLGTVVAGVAAPGVCDLFVLLEIACECALVQYGLFVAMTNGRMFFLRPSAKRPRPRAAPAGTQATAVKERLLLHMHASRCYRNPDLRIPDLARALQVPPHTLSRLINREFGSNFSDFVNSYRVQEAARLLVDPARRQYTIFSIALDVGFASKASFNRAFKRHLGVTPSEYQRRGWISAGNSRSR